MVARVATIAFNGIRTCDVDVQVQILPGLSAFSIVGLVDKAVAESRERVRAALNAIGLSLPPKRITVNLAPADLPKEGNHYDLPIALGLMVAMGVLPQDMMNDFVAVGELALDGSVSSVAGVLPAAINAHARDRGVICPADCGAEAAWADADMSILAPRDLVALVNHFSGVQILSRPLPVAQEENDFLPDLRDVKGQESAKRALEIAAAGGHNLLMVGPPGSGKSMLAARLPSILPPLIPSEMLEVSMIHSIAGRLSNRIVSRRPPFRNPHHSASMAALVGGGSRARPGEVSLAHLGVLFLDELPEFAPQALDSLRQSLETGEVVVARANHHIAYPSRIQLVAAMNPCRCGMAGEPGYTCARGPRCLTDYQARLSGPLIDRIDLQIEMPSISAATLVLPPPAEGSAEVAIRVAAARARQVERYAAFGVERVRNNAECPVHLLDDVVALDADGRDFLRDAAERMQLSARGYHRVLKVARTLADLQNMKTVSRIHLAEALIYRGVLGEKRGY